jgi:hypothetical protein
MGEKRPIFGILSLLLLLAAVVTVVIFILGSEDHLDTSDNEHIAVAVEGATTVLRSILISAAFVAASILISLIALARGERKLFPLISLGVGITVILLFAWSLLLK